MGQEPIPLDLVAQLEALLRESRGLACPENDGSAPCKMPGGPCWEHRRRALLAHIDELRTR